MSVIPTGARLAARSIELTGRKNDHRLGGWCLRDIQFQAKPDTPGTIIPDQPRARPAIVCLACGAYAAIVTDDGAHFWTPSFARPCAAATSPPTTPEAA